MTAAQEAITYVERRASLARDESLRRLDPFAGLPVLNLANAIRRTARLTLNFHPDRVDRFGRTVAAGLLADGRYRPQNETWLSGGSRSALRGGERFGFEANLFGRAYNRLPETRPVYGALDVTHDPFGAAPFAGSSVVVLDNACLDRSTFCVGDSYLGPTDVGTIQQFNSILAGMLEQASQGSGYGLSAFGLTDAIVDGVRSTKPCRLLDGYVEAQIHGGISLAADVVAIVLDPSFRGTDIAQDLSDAAATYDFEIRWHCGSQLAVADVPPDLRGTAMPEFASTVIEVEDGSDRLLDAAIIGRSLANALANEPASPPRVGGDGPLSTRQLHKKLWHCIFHLGHPHQSRETSP